MSLYYTDENVNIELGFVLTNHSMSIEDAIEILGINLDEFAYEQGWDDYEYEALRIC